ncbi:MAG: ABC transporter substrate-binding protein [Lachnospiraceae bacterium]|nr:ABC transporter substrate-binding protein [Lachnospiraceae bacterium]
MKKRVLGMLLAGVMAVSAFTACGNTESGSTAATNPDAGETEEAAAETEEVTETEEGEEVEAEAPETSEGGALTGTLNLGCIGPMTGGAAIYGNAVQNGAKIAVDEINALGSDFQMTLNVQDDEHDAQKSVNCYNTLKDADTQVIVGTVTTAPCIAVGEEAYNDRMFMLTPSASSTDVTADKDNIFQLCFADPNQGSASAQYIYDNQLATKVAVIYNNADAYSSGIYQTFKAKADELGLDIVSETTFTDDTANDFSVQVGQAKDAGADLIFLPIYYTPASLILGQAYDMGYTPKFFGVDGMDGILTLEGFDTSKAEGVILLTPFSADAEDAATQSFVGKYNDQFGETPSQFAADGYDCPYAIYKALQFYADKNGGLDVTGMSYDEICEILISVFTDADFSVDGITGQGMVWDANGEVNKAPKAVVITNGVYVGM